MSALASTSDSDKHTHNVSNNPRSFVSNKGTDNVTDNVTNNHSDIVSNNSDNPNQGAGSMLTPIEDRNLTFFRETIVRPLTDLIEKQSKELSDLARENERLKLENEQLKARPGQDRSLLTNAIIKTGWLETAWATLPIQVCQTYADMV